MSTGTNQTRIVEVAVGIVVDKVSRNPSLFGPASGCGVHANSALNVPRLLITRRKPDQVLAGLWELPGGKLDPGESPAEAVVRELHEEVGIDVAPVARLKPVEHHYDHAHVRLIPFICEHIAGDPQPLHVDEVRWVTPDQLTQHTFPDASMPVLDELVGWLKENL